MWKNYELPIQGLNNILIRLIQQIDTFWYKLFEALPIPKLQIPKILIKAPMVKHFHLDLPCRSIYVNSGTWVDSAPYCTMWRPRKMSKQDVTMCGFGPILQKNILIKNYFRRSM